MYSQEAAIIAFARASGHQHVAAMPICARTRYPSGVLYDNHALFRLRTKTRRSRGLLGGRGTFRSGGESDETDASDSHSRSSMHALRIMPPCPHAPILPHARVCIRAIAVPLAFISLPPPPPRSPSTSTTRRPACRRLSSFSDEDGMRVAVAPPSTKAASHRRGTFTPIPGSALERGTDPSAVSASPTSRVCEASA